MVNSFGKDKFRKKSNFNSGNIKDFKKKDFKDRDFEKKEFKFEPEESAELIKDFVFPDDFEFQNFEINKNILYSIYKAGFLKPTEVQKLILLNNGDDDIIAQSNTGSGKTLAFSIPILNDILEKRKNKVLILAPTREIAFQINDLMTKIIKRSWQVTNTVLVGGVPIERQVEKLNRNVNIIIGTPGRIIDLLDRKKLDLSTVDFVVLDEFDRMLDMGFRDDVRLIMNKCSKNSKNFMLSATLNEKVKQDSLEYLKNPKILIVKNQEDSSVNPNIKQFFEYYNGYEEKKQKLQEILKNYHGKSILIFTNTKAEAENIVHNLYLDNIPSEYIHGDLHQKKRQNIMKNFGDKFRILVATNLVARGINISSLELVINYDIPKNTEDYTHRIGRTARGENKEGHSISLFNNKDGFFLKDLVKSLKIKIEDQKALETMENSDRRQTSSKRRGFSRNDSFRSNFSGPSRSDGDNKFNRKRKFSSNGSSFSGYSRGYSSGSGEYSGSSSGYSGGGSNSNRSSFNPNRSSSSNRFGSNKFDSNRSSSRSSNRSSNFSDKKRFKKF